MNKKSGFTLVEMAIVMVIIGLLVGGLMKGQEIMRTAQINALISDLSGLDTAFTQFCNKYGAMPGDIVAPANILPNCAGECTNGGDADAQIMDVDNFESDMPPTFTDEKLSAFLHLSAAGLITGITGESIRFGVGLPSANVGGGYWLGHDLGTATATIPQVHRSGTYISYGESLETAADEHLGGLLGSEVATIDRKADDGAPYGGKIVNHGDPANCVTGTAYVENGVIANCSLAMKTTTR